MTKVLILATVWIVGGLLLHYWADRWDCQYRPQRPDEVMPMKGMVGGWGLVLMSFFWLGLMLWIAGNVVMRIL